VRIGAEFGKYGLFTVIFRPRNKPVLSEKVLLFVYKYFPSLLSLFERPLWTIDVDGCRWWWFQAISGCAKWSKTSSRPTARTDRATNTCLSLQDEPTHQRSKATYGYLRYYERDWVLCLVRNGHVFGEGGLFGRIFGAADRLTPTATPERALCR
jgi:hypothetical protein